MNNENQKYVDYIIQSLREINPYNDNEGRIGYVYASGFLAAVLADLMLNDNKNYYKFKQHIDKLKQYPPRKPDQQAQSKG